MPSSLKMEQQVYSPKEDNYLLRTKGQIIISHEFVREGGIILAKYNYPCLHRTTHNLKLIAYAYKHCYIVYLYNENTQLK